MAGWESCEERLSVINPDEREIVDTAAALSDDISTQETSLAPKVSCNQLIVFQSFIDEVLNPTTPSASLTQSTTDYTIGPILAVVFWVTGGAMNIRLV